MWKLWSILVVVIFAACVESDGDSLLKPCLVKDIECLSKSTEQFLVRTAAGIPDYDMKAIDPLIISTLDFDVDDNMGLKFSFKNLNVTGLRSQKISEFQMNTDTKKVLLQTKANLHIVGDLTIELTKDSKTFSGVYNADASVLNTARYSYGVKKNVATNVEHFEVGPESIECETVSEPTVTLNAELQAALANDDAAKIRLPEYTSKAVTLRKKAFCNIAKLGYINVIHNIRAAAKILPKTAFFIDV